MCAFLLVACKSTNNADQLTYANTPLLKYLSELSSDGMEGRKFGSSGSEKAQKYIVSQLQRIGIPPLNKSYYHPFIKKSFLDNTAGNNLIAIVNGQQNSKYIVLTAHYDHLGMTGRKIYNGTDDNASGVAALLDYAGKLKNIKLNHSVIFLFSDGEEVDLLGSKAFLNDFPEVKRNIKLNINLDMIAGNKNTKKLHYLTKGLIELFDEREELSWLELIEESDIAIKKGFKTSNRVDHYRRKTRWELASDHGVFYQSNIPFLYYGVGTHKNYHTPSDTFDNINHAFFQNAVSEIFRHILFIDQHI